MSDRTRRAGVVAPALAALVVFVVAGGLMFTAFASLVWALTFSAPISGVAGAAMGLLTGGLVATPFIQMVLRSRHARRRG